MRFLSIPAAILLCIVFSGSSIADGLEEGRAKNRRVELVKK